MAKVVFGAIVNLILGRLNDKVFSINRGGPYVKVHNPDINWPEVRPRWEFCRDNFILINERWATLEDLKRKTWHLLASRMNLHGDGNCAYTRINGRLLDSDHVDLVLIDDPPPSPDIVPLMQNFQAVASGVAENEISWGAPLDDSNYIQIYWRRHKPNPDGVHPYWHQVICLRSDTGSYIHAHGLAAGRVVYYKIRVINKKGQISPWTHKIKVVCM